MVIRMRRLMMILATLSCTMPAFAQTPNPERFRNGSIGVEFMRPMVEDAEDMTLMGSVLYARVPVGGVHILAEVPYAVLDDDLGGSQALGNIMLGMEATRGKATLFGLVRAPTAPDDELASFVGLVSDFLRPEAWVPDVWSVSAGARLHSRRPSGVGYDVLIGVSVLAPRDEDKEVLLDYGAQLSYRPRAFGFAGGISGRAVTTGEDATFGERTMHEATARLDYTAGRWRPLLDFRVALDKDMREAVDGVLRIGVEYALN
jgi:hypothetical protein